ncbi:U6 snRNA phosphodiesterase isoform X2 [Ceratina calcarata]|uniref:U6 snRNA phosphodiesterase 1 n=1 Tax=Ceratina calcarata TaxID=156304 RepID=A0AAJ7IZ12_9HYME|nr:U6 snRNA phosphodiesterase isoform X2 [Ceratina calcarata]
MSGLDLLSAYTSDSEDDEVNNETSNQNVDRLPLPGIIASWKGVPHHEEVEDDPSQHDGRTRSFKHERDKLSEAIDSWMFSVLDKVPVKCNIFSDEFHVSITRTVILKFHWIESFVEETKKLCSQTDRFSLELINVRAYINEERTRTFLGIECADCKGILTQFVKGVNKILAEYELPPFYDDISYHVSFLWCIGDEFTALNNCVPTLTSTLTHFLIEHPEERYIDVTKIHLKIGNKLYVFNLR